MNPQVHAQIIALCKSGVDEYLKHSHHLFLYVKVKDNWERPGHTIRVFDGKRKTSGFQGTSVSFGAASKVAGKTQWVWASASWGITRSASGFTAEYLQGYGNTQAKAENKNVCCKLSIYFWSKLFKINSEPMKIVIKADDKKL